MAVALASAPEWRVTCDHPALCGWVAFIPAADEERLAELLRARNWVFKRAEGKTYCPRHIPKEGS